jgi:fatty acid-binding protein DegV
MGKKIAIVTDSSSGLNNKSYKDFYVIPLNISEVIKTETKNYKDGIEITNEEISKKMIDGALIKTSSSAVGDVVQLLSEICEKYDEIYCFPIPISISNSYNS